jgi:hypothetical protein
MASGVGEVDTPPAVVVVDLARAVAHLFTGGSNTGMGG